MTHWAATMYRVWLMTTKGPARLYEWEVWRTLMPDLDGILALSPVPAVIRSSQTFDDDDRLLPFGRMLWSLRTNHQWTTRYREPEYADRAWRFRATEIQAPGPDVAERENVPPDVLIKVDAESMEDGVSQGMIIAVRAELADENEEAVGDRIESLTRLVPGVHVRDFSRAWAEDVRDTGYSNGLSDQTSWFLQYWLER